MGGFIVPYTVPSAAFWKLGQAKPGDQLKFKEVSLEKAQEMRTEQTLTCSEKSVLSASQINNEETNKTKIKIDKIKIIDFDKEKKNERMRKKMIEKRGMKNIKVRFF